MLIDHTIAKSIRRGAWSFAALLAIGPLLLIPFLETTDMAIGAGLVAIAMGWAGYYFGTKKMHRRQKIAAQAFPEAWAEILEEKVRYYQLLNPNDRQRFQKMLAIFLDETRISGIGVTLSQSDRLLVGASAIIPILGWPSWEYRYLSEVLVYPGQFNRDYQTDRDEKPSILGMVHGSLNNGVLILSLPSLKQGFTNPVDKRNVGIHEFVHMLDKNDGTIDGLPATLAGAISKPWRTMLEDMLDRDKKFPRDIDRYGQTNRAEFLSVISEYFFENPQSLAKHHPDIYQMLKSVYRQDPLALLRENLRQFSPRRTLNRKKDCPCGSQKKGKHCCLKQKA